MSRSSFLMRCYAYWIFLASSFRSRPWSLLVACGSRSVSPQFHLLFLSMRLTVDFQALSTLPWSSTHSASLAPHSMPAPLSRHLAGISTLSRSPAVISTIAILLHSRADTNVQMRRASGSPTRLIPALIQRVGSSALPRGNRSEK